MGGSQTTNQTSESQSVNEIPQWVQNAGQQNYAVAQDVASQPLQQYQGQLVAGVSPQLQQGWNLAANSGAIGQGSQSAGEAALMSGAGYTPQQITPAQLSSTNLQPYMNPYTQSVINATLPIMQQNLALSQNQQQNQANSANAFGGSRQAIQQGVTQAQGAMGMGQMAAGLNQANFAQAQQGALSDVAAQNAAMAANQQAGLTGNQQQIAAGQGLGNLGLQQMQNNIANYGMLTSAGGLEQQQQQNDINAQVAQLQQAQTYPQQQLGALESALGMTPYNTGTSGSSASTTQVSSNNPAAIIQGAMQMAGSALSGGGTGALLSALGLGNSDRRLKTDIKKIGMHHTGIPIYSYRYKGDPKSYPKVAGPMAEDVMKIAPHAVRRMDTKGHLAVHMPTLDALSPRGLPPSSPGVAKAIGMLAQRGPLPGGGLSPMATPPSRSLASMTKRPRIVGALGG